MKDEDITAYKGIGPEAGKLIYKEDAFQYALNDMMGSPDSRTAFVELWLSGDFVTLTKEELEKEIGGQIWKN